MYRICLMFLTIVLGVDFCAELSDLIYASPTKPKVLSALAGLFIRFIAILSFYYILHNSLPL